MAVFLHDIFRLRFSLSRSMSRVMTWASIHLKHSNTWASARRQTHYGPSSHCRSTLKLMPRSAAFLGAMSNELLSSKLKTFHCLWAAKASHVTLSTLIATKYRVNMVTHGEGEILSLLHLGNAYPLWSFLWMKVIFCLCLAARSILSVHICNVYGTFSKWAAD